MIIFTDGSTLNNGKKNAIGGIGIYIPGQGDIPEIAISYSLISSSVVKVTNQISELIATIMGIVKLLSLRPANSEETIYIYTDSKYVIDCATTWCKTWLTNGWKNSKGKTVDNIWLIYRLVQLTKKYPIIFKHIKAHTDEPDKNSDHYILWKGNDFVDKLAQEASRNASEALVNAHLNTNVNIRILNWKAFARMMLLGIQCDMKMNLPYCDDINIYYKNILDYIGETEEPNIEVQVKKKGKKANNETNANTNEISTKRKVILEI
jgi:ribonuclease HI